MLLFLSILFREMFTEQKKSLQHMHSKKICLLSLFEEVTGNILRDVCLDHTRLHAE